MVEDIYGRFGVRTWINAGGYLTRLGGAQMRQEVLDAMREASGHFVDVMELQSAASAVISHYTGTEAAIVTAGAAAALTLATAAAMAGLDPVRMNRLPDTAGMPNEVVMHRSHRSSYDHAIRAAGAKIVDFGFNDRALDAGFRGLEVWEAAAAVTEATVAFAFAATPHNLRDLETIAGVASRHRIPVIVDAAPWLPPTENLRRFRDAGGTLIAYSGGKAIGGPAGTGFLCGPRDLIASALLQQADMTVIPEHWTPPPKLIPADRLAAIPRHGIGRGMKVSKEEIVGLLVAIELFASADQAAELDRMAALLRTVEEGLAQVPHIGLRFVMAQETGRRPLLEIKIDARVLGRTAFDVAATLRTSTPPVQMNERNASDGVLTVDPASLRDADVPQLLSALRSALARPHQARA